MYNQESSSASPHTMVSVTHCFSEGYKLFWKTAWIFVIPLFLDILDMFQRIAEILPNTVSYGVKFSLPVYLPSLSDVYNFPSSSRSVQIGNAPITSSNLLLGILAVVLFAALMAFLAGGYLGTMDAKRRKSSSSSSFFLMCGKYFGRLFGYALIWIFITSVGALFILSNAPLLVIPYILFLFVVEYFLFLTPFAIVSDGATLQSALSKSIEFAKGRAGSVLSFVIIYAILSALTSVVIYFVMNAGVGGYLLNAVLYAVVGSILVCSTLVLYSDISSPPTPSFNTFIETRPEEPTDPNVSGGL